MSPFTVTLSNLCFADVSTDKGAFGSTVEHFSHHQEISLNGLQTVKQFFTQLALLLYAITQQQLNTSVLFNGISSTRRTAVIETIGRESEKKS